MITSNFFKVVSKGSMSEKNFHFDLTISVVLYKPQMQVFREMLSSVQRCGLNYKLYLIDNSPVDAISASISDPRVEYIFTGENVGFGKAHNIALRKAVKEAPFHVVLNPDVSFPEGTLEMLQQYMERSPDVGLVMPKVLNMNHELQYLCKRLPSPLELFFRRFIPANFTWIRKRLESYEMREMNYESEFEAPYLSGCFMFLRTEAIARIGYFDERYFMYMEDIDLSRRIFSEYRNVYYPKARIYHVHARESYKTFRLLKIHIISAIQYFNKWGWFVDSDRRRLNQGNSASDSRSFALRPVALEKSLSEG
jgi:GT2 family glycosyltransferase